MVYPGAHPAGCGAPVKEDKLYLFHIRECIERIEVYTGGGKPAFFAENIIQDAVVRNLQMLAESSQRLSASLKDHHSEQDWRSLAGLRNVLVHDYLGIKLDRVWEFVTVDLPKLKRQIDIMLEQTT